LNRKGFPTFQSDMQLKWIWSGSCLDVQGFTQSDSVTYLIKIT